MMAAETFPITGADSSQILKTPELTAALAGMFPPGRVPSALRLLIARDGGIKEESFKAAMLDVAEAVLVIIHATTNFIFGAVIFDGGHELRDRIEMEGGGTYVAGDPDNFLFRLVGSTARVEPTKLLKTAGEEPYGLYVGFGDWGLWLGWNDLRTFCANGKRGNCCKPRSFTTVAPGYPQVPVTNETLAGAEEWVPVRSEVYAISAFH